MLRIEDKNVDFREGDGNKKRNLVNVKRKDGAIDFYFLEEKAAWRCS